MTSTNCMQAFVRRPRLARTTPEWDACEVEWWNANAALIERIWGLPEPLCRGARKRYIEDIRSLFLELKPTRPLRIVEVACGSGWPGRLLASPDLKVTGVDFSEGQIKIARAKAVETGKVNCDYLRMDINQMGGCFGSNQFDGAFVHCGIHHLSSAELNHFADVLAQSPKGFPTILVEPAYLDRTNQFGRLLGRLLARSSVLIRRGFLARPSQDKAVTQSTERLIKLAADNGWFLSPKEIPFDVREIRNLFSRHFEIREIAPVTHFGLEAAQYLSTLEDQELASKAAAGMLPILNLIDRCLINTGLLPTITDGYLFSRIVLIRK